MKIIIITICFALLALHTANAQAPAVPDNQIIMCLLPLDHANAQELANVLKPFLSPSGTIASYPPANTLIIKDRVSVVRSLIKVAKGKKNLGECQNLRSDN